MKPAMTYASVCDGIGAAHVAWQPLGWRCAWTSEIDPFPAAVVEQRWGFVNHGDMTKLGDKQLEPIDLLVGGTPCQSFSVAGLRKGLADPRGNLALVFLGLVDRLRPRWVVWENVPGVLSSSGGRDFGAFLGGLGQLGYGWAYRVLDAQYVRVESHARAVPQRRRRVFVVGYLGDWRRATAVLFEREGLSRHPAPRRKAGQGFAAHVIKGAAIGRKPENGPQYGDAISDGSCYTLNCTEQHAVASTGDISHCLNAGGMGRIEYETETLIAHSLKAGGFDASEDGTGCGTPIVPVAFNWQSGGSKSFLSARETHTDALSANQTPAVAFTQNQAGDVLTGAVTASMGTNCNATGRNTPKAQIGMQVRRLTPTECEKLQGFPPGYTAITYRNKPAADGPRYKALGNSMACNVMSWIGQRIAAVEQIGGGK